MHEERTNERVMQMVGVRKLKFNLRHNHGLRFVAWGNQYGVNKTREHPSSSNKWTRTSMIARLMQERRPGINCITK